MNRDDLRSRALTLASSIDGGRVQIERSALQIHETMLAHSDRIQHKWIDAVELAARKLIDEGETNLVGSRLGRLAERIYQEEL